MFLHLMLQPLDMVDVVAEGAYYTLVMIHILFARARSGHFMTFGGIKQLPIN